MASTINAKNTSTGVVITPDASGQLELQTADTTRMTITSSGKVGIGNTSPATTGTAGMTIGVNTILSDVVNGQSLFGNNVYYDGSWKYYTTGVYTAVRQQNGAVTFHSGPSASAGSAASNMDTTDVKMIIDSSGNVGIGTSSPSNKLDVNGVVNASTATTTADAYKFSGWSLIGGDVYDLKFGGYTNGQFRQILFYANNSSGVSSERMRIDSSGNLQLSTANTSILNSSGRKILNQTGGTLQVLQAVKTDVFSVASSTFTDVTGMSVSITPSSTSSKILILVDAQIAQSGADATMIKLVRNTTDIFIGDAAGSRIRTSTAKSFTANGIESGSIIFLDSPATTSSTTYKIQMRALTGTAYLNRSGADTDNGAHPRTASSITVMEIAG